MNKIFLRNIIFVIGLIAVVASTGCNIDAGGWVYIDNGGDGAMRVEMDGELVCVIPPGEFDRVAAKSGDHQFKVVLDGRTIFEGTKTVAAPSGFMQPHRYMFNPDGQNRYWSYEIQYGDEETLREQMLRHSRNTLDQEYRELCNEIEVMPTDSWFEIPGRPYILSDSPDEMMMDEREKIKTVRILSRATLGNYEYLKNAASNRNPSEADFDELIERFEISMIE